MLHLTTGLAAGLALGLNSHAAHAAHIPTTKPAQARATLVHMMADGTPDPTDSPFLNLINSLQEAIQTSPAAAFKAKLAKLQAGDYDEAAVAAAVADQIKTTPCIMYSFTT